MVPETNLNKKQGVADTPPTQPSPRTTPEQERKQGNNIRPLKTYLADVQTAIKEQNESIAKIALAERDRRESRKEKEPQGGVSPQQKKIMLVGGGIFALMVVLGGGYGAIRFFNIQFSFPGLGEPIVEVRGKITTDAILSPSHEKEISVSGLTLSSLVAVITEEANTERGARSLENIFFTEPLVAPVEGVSLGKEIVSAQEFFSLYLSGAPEFLTRTLTPQFMLGVHHDTTKTGNVFLILKTTSFETALAGMLRWEKTMVHDIGRLLNVRTEDTQGFKDIVIHNKDTRALLDRSREPVLIYSFIDRNTILVAPNRRTFGDILNVLNQPKQITQ